MNRHPVPRPANNSVRSVNYATSPLLASKTPPWRSRFVVALVGLAFLVLVGRAVYIQIIGTDFYQKEGEKRFMHTLDVSASRGRVLDRNGLVLATSVPAPSLWAIPKDFDADPAQRKPTARSADSSRSCWACRWPSWTKGWRVHPISPGWRARSTSRCGSR